MLNFESVLKTVEGAVLVDNSSDIQYTPYTNNSQKAWTELAVSGETYDNILYQFYSDKGVKLNIEVRDFSTSVPNGYIARLERPYRNNSFFYGWGGLEGECAWYATGRAKEILSQIDSKYTWTANPNGGDFCDVADAKRFVINNDVTSPKPGSLVVWKSNSYGHVGVIESVNGDNVTISEAYISLGMGDELYGSKEALRRALRSGKITRKWNCEANNSGCFQTVTMNVSKIKNRWGYRFECYVYLTDPK